MEKDCNLPNIAKAIFLLLNMQIFFRWTFQTYEFRLHSRSMQKVQKHLFRKIKKLAQNLNQFLKKKTGVFVFIFRTMQIKRKKILLLMNPMKIIKTILHPRG